MKCMQTICVLALGTWAAAVSADDFSGRSYVAHTQEPVALPAPANADFPAEAYPAGFTSYRGLGFMGYCCEQPSGAEILWKDFCANRDHHAKLFDHWGWGQAGCRSYQGACYGANGWGSWCGTNGRGSCCGANGRGSCCGASERGACCRAQACGSCGCCDLGCAGPGANYWPASACGAPRGGLKKSAPRGCVGVRDRCAAPCSVASNDCADEGGVVTAAPPLTLDPAPAVIPAIPPSDPPPAPPVPTTEAARYRLLDPNPPAASFLRVPTPSPEDKSA